MSGCRVLGVTGGIACGKSLVGAGLAKLGASLLSADEISREVVAPGGSILQRLAEVFGDEVLTADGHLDREHLGRIVFADPLRRQELNALMHPAIAALSELRLRELKEQAPPLIVYEAPLLFEADAESRVDEVLVVFVDPDVQLARLCARDGIDRKTAQTRVAAHWPQHVKIARADYVIDNSGSVEETLRQVEALYDYLIRSVRAC